MKYLVIALIICIVVLLYDKTKKKPTPKQAEISKPAEITTGVPKDDTDYSNAYQKKWLLTYNEKDAYKKIKEVTDELGLTVFTKVRLFDLVEPKTDFKNRKGAQWKIQAKHVDFVICDQKLVARFIIELDDSSHDAKVRAERDIFVDTVLENTGYKVIHLKGIDKEQLRKQLDERSSQISTI